MNSLKNDMKTVQGIIYEAYKTSGQLLALLDGQDTDPNSVADALDKMAAQFEVALSHCGTSAKESSRFPDKRRKAGDFFYLKHENYPTFH